MFTYARTRRTSRAHTAFKVGTQVRTGWSQELFTTRGDIVQIISQRQAQFGLADEHAERPQGIGHATAAFYVAGFVADRQPVTLNLGVRYERFDMSIPAQGAPAGTWAPAREFPAQDNIVNWNTVSPRFGFSWDVFGNGETAVKGGVSRYDRMAGITIVQPLNQRNIALPDLPLDRHQRRPDGAELARSPSTAAPARWCRARGGGPEPEAAAPVGVHGDDPAADWPEPDVGQPRLLRPPLHRSVHDRQRRRAAGGLYAGARSSIRSPASR